ncbi:hypothetical protein E2C01_038590 [Portunus trituberculatus]|uniref:Uncharacterized protein n=1 Tax=Portunus trituberculatus TaxID=210409 RepID=A0A5B7FB76_PORTR|nr:hypothetical protein [Portunus trituberculatus]
MAIAPGDFQLPGPPLLPPEYSSGSATTYGFSREGSCGSSLVASPSMVLHTTTMDSQLPVFGKQLSSQLFDDQTTEISLPSCVEFLCQALRRK